jgi:hypothetical protein
VEQEDMPVLAALGLIMVRLLKMEQEAVEQEVNVGGLTNIALVEVVVE